MVTSFWALAPFNFERELGKRSRTLERTTKFKWCWFEFVERLQDFWNSWLYGVSEAKKKGCNIPFLDVDPGISLNPLSIANPVG